MKYTITFLSIFVLSIFGNSQINPIYKESIENYYAKKKAENNFQFIKSEITDVKSSFQYVSDSLGLESVLKMIKKSLSLYKQSDDFRKNSYAQLTMMTLDIYFEGKDKYLKKDTSKVYLIKGNILYSVMENFQKKTIYEDFIMIFSPDDKVISHHVID